MAGLSVRLVAVVAAVLGVSAPAHADTRADIRAAFAGFVARVAKQQVPTVALFLPPGAGDEAVPTDLQELVKQLPKPVVTVSTVVVSPGGKSAWLAGEIAAFSTRADKPRAGKLRASAVLQLEGATWQVVATQWSWPRKESPQRGCGLIAGWEVESKVPASHAALRRQLHDALTAPRAARFRALVSDDERAWLIGSAPGEKLVGSAKIKKLFERFRLNTWSDGGDTGFAGSTADSALTWVAMPMSVHELCVGYRAFIVFHAEPAGPRMIHQHYANASDLWPD